MYRQGDLLLVPADVPQTATLIHDGVIVRGRATGHAHRLVGDGTLLEDSGTGTQYIVSVTATIVHEEHAPIRLPAGTYAVRRQREYQPAGWRQVED